MVKIIPADFQDLIYHGFRPTWRCPARHGHPPTDEPENTDDPAYGAISREALGKRKRFSACISIILVVGPMREKKFEMLAHQAMVRALIRGVI